jgi:putative hydrolase of the HAD superfamily
VRRKAILFDLFGTLVNTVTPADYQAMLRAVADALGAPSGAFSVHWRAEIETRESGHLGGVEEVLAATSRGVGHDPSPAAVARAAEAWLTVARRWLTPREGAIETINAFRESGYRIGLVSNCSAEVPRLWPEDALAPFIDAPVFSCEAGTMKPDPAIYLRACDQLDVPPEACLFAGDGGAQELTGAAALGMTAVLLRVPGEEHTWFDETYRRDALDWQGDSVAAIEELTRYISR